LLALVTIAATSSVLAAPKKKGPKPKPADTTETAPPASSSAPASADQAPAAAEPAPASTAATAAETTPAKGDAAAETKPTVDNTDTKEDPNVRYYFIGLRYRGTIIPQFFESLFVDEGRTVYSNTFGVEIDMRKGGQSMIPWIIFTEYGMSDTLFHQKGTDTALPGNYSVVNSSLKALYLGLDELWSAPIDESHHWDFEYGFGVGIGIVFGDLQNNWVHVDDTNGPLQATTGNPPHRYARCQLATDGPGCSTSDHQNAPVAKVGNYVEKNWFNGGSVPVIFPNIVFPSLGVRYKPIKQFEARFHVGFSLTGFWFGLSADYGLEKAEDKSVKASSSLSHMRDML
jgi:hypothetical protein